MESVATQPVAVRELIAPEIAELLRAGRTTEARANLIEFLDPEIADVLLALEPAQRAVAFRLLPRARAASVYTFIPADESEELVEQLTSDQLARLLEEMEPDDRVEQLDELPAAVVQRILAAMTPENRALTQTILNYPLESVGRFMTPNYLRVKSEWTAERALEQIRKRGGRVESLNKLYVTDAAGKLLNEVRLREVLLAGPQDIIGDLATSQVVALQATDDQEEAVRAMERYDSPVLPVVNSDGVLVGIVTFDDVADVAEEEATEDIQKMAAVEKLDEPYITVPLPTLIRKRAIWLGILFVGQMATISALAIFEKQLQKAEALILFIPLLISSGGNSGSQAASLIIRALSLGEIGFSDWWRVMRREFLCGIALGSLLATFGAGRIIVWNLLGWGPIDDYIAQLCITVGISLLAIVTWGTLVGSMLPIMLQRIGFDPASSSTPLVATILDVTGIVIYFSTAMFVLRGTML